MILICLGASNKSIYRHVVPRSEPLLSNTGIALTVVGVMLVASLIGNTVTNVMLLKRRHTSKRYT